MSNKINNLDDPRFLAPCATNCGVCPWRIAYITNDQKLKEKLAPMVGIKPEEIICDGCRSDNPLFFCKNCTIKKCVLEKDKESCAECDDFPCNVIEKYPFKEFLKRVYWDVKYRKENGKEKWLEKTLEMNTCPSCNALAHWRASICKSCGTKLEKRYE